jgi:hypothetical protein
MFGLVKLRVQVRSTFVKLFSYKVYNKIKLP